MTYKARFVHGTRYFNLDAGEYDLFRDFIFPVSEESLNIGAAAARSMTGGEVVSKTAQDRWWAWSVRIMGDSGTHTHQAAGRLSAWLNNALSDKTSELYFEYIPNYVTPAPIWGQHGQPYRWKVKVAIVDIDGGYYVANIPDVALILPISLLVGPYALGKRQKLAQAKGAVFEDTRGTVDGISRGTVINGGITNKIINPSFETNTTGWTAADSTIERTADQAWVGSYGMRVTVSTLNTAASAYITVNTGAPLTQQNYIASARVYVPAQMAGYDVSLMFWESGGASAAESTVTKAQTVTEGWNYVFATGTVKKADRTALQLFLYIQATGSPPAGSWVIWDAVQVLGPDVYNIYPYVDGDQIGCAWTSTAHASTSTSTGGYVRIPVSSADTFNMKQGSVRAVMKMPYANTDVPSGVNNRVFFTDTNLRVHFYETDDKFYIHDDTATVGVAATWAAGDIITVHATWGPDGMKVYFNGTASASQTYTNPGAAAYCYIGSNDSAPPTERILATFLDFSVWDVPLTAAQVTADYAQVNAHVDGGDGYGQRLSSIPYLWTKDGDNVVDNYTLSTTHNHFAIVAGIQGSVEAETELSGTLSADNMELNMSLFATKNYYNPANLFVDNSGAGTADTVGGEAHVTSLSTTSIEISDDDPVLTWSSYTNKELSGKTFTVLARIKDAVNGYLRIDPRIYAGGYTIAYNNLSRPYYTETTQWRLFKTPMVSSMVDRNPELDFTFTYTVKLFGYRNTGTNNITVDYVALFPRPYMYMYFGSTIETFKLIGDNMQIVSGGAFAGYAAIQPITGDPIEFVPNKYNALLTLMGGAYDEPTMAETLTYNSAYYTPRYLLI